MIYGSVCSGVEAASLALEPLGWKPAFYSEIEPAARSVLRHRWPHVPCHGDFRTIKEKTYAAIDALIAGTPCQDFSVAGLRKGLAGDRGVLTIEFVRLFERLRPEWFLFENVPGILSSESGKAFGLFLAQAAGYPKGYALTPPLGGWGNTGIVAPANERSYGLAWRVLDAQYFGIPQRRRRVFVVGHLGDWRPSAAVLLEWESMSGNPAPRRKKGKGASHDVAPCLDASGCGVRNTGDIRGQDPVVAFEEVAHTLKAAGADASEDGSGRGTPIIPIMEATRRQGNSTNDPRYAIGIGQVGDPMYALNTAGAHAVAYRMQKFGKYADDDIGSTLKSRDHKDATDLVAFDCRGTEVHNRTDNVAPTLRAQNFDKSHMNGGGQLAVAIGLDGENNAMIEGMGTLRSHKSGGHESAVMTSAAAVRRLTPRECERLQGMPDDHTLVPIHAENDRRRKKKIAMMSDSARYRLIGNSFPVPAIQWIGRRIDFINTLLKEIDHASRHV